ncbi:MAG: hypothetical protein FJ104_00825 [Deltaproteobacteria bacterium]|nr:hypothetical protein [Deltaproteobacteria bacterium]
MRRNILILCLALGAVGGFTAGIASLRRAQGHHGEAFRDRIAETCVRAAERVVLEKGTRGPDPAVGSAPP